MNKNKHLSLDDRIRIDELLKESYSFKAIAGELGKNPTTIAREVRAHIVLRNVGAPGRLYNNCTTKKEMATHSTKRLDVLSSLFSAMTVDSDVSAHTVNSADCVTVYVHSMSRIPVLF